MKKITPTTETRMWKVISALLGIALIGVLVQMYMYESPEAALRAENRTKYPLISLARHITPSEHFLSTVQPLRERVHALVDAEKNVKMSVYIEFLNTGSNISVNNDERYWPASLSKVPLAMAVMGTIESGIWTLDQKLTLEESDKMATSSSLHTYETGTQFTVRQLLEELLIRSDNTAYRILGRNLPESRLAAVKEALGLENLFDREGEVTARQYSRLFRSLYTANYLNREDSQYLLDLLNKAEWTKFLRASVPETVPFPHKYGIEPDRHTYSDSGIVYVQNRPYLITVMIEGDGTESSIEEAQHATRIMNTISQAAYAFFSTAQNREL